MQMAGAQHRYTIRHAPPVIEVDATLGARVGGLGAVGNPVQTIGRKHAQPLVVMAIVEQACFAVQQAADFTR